MAKPAVRLGAVQLAFALGLAVILVRAGQVQIAQGRRYANEATAQQTERVVLPARRGAIYDRNGVPLAFTIEHYRVEIARNELRNRDQAAELLTRHLQVPGREVRRQLRRSYGYFHGPFTSAQVAPLRSVRGIKVRGPELQRFYPDPSLARPLIGRPASAGVMAGGIERVLDSLLEGTPGSAVVLRDRDGTRYESPARWGGFPVAGNDVYLTIDAALQDIVESELEAALQEYAATGGDVVVLDPKSGEILAVASRDRDGRSTAGAFTDAFEPGSTAKVLIAAALLGAGAAQLTDSVWAEQGVFKTEHRTITDEHPSGWLTLRQVIELSSNIGIVKLAATLPRETQYTTLRAFGLGSPTGVEFPSESPGTLRLPESWSALTQASLAMGYELAVTPLQLAQAYAAIANDGVLLRPTLVLEVRAPSGRVLFRHRPEPIRRVITPAIAAQLREALRGVVYRGGTGETAALQSYEVAGKTGTARRAVRGGYEPGSYTSSFTSLFPAEDPQLAMVVRLDDPKGTYARATAAPVTKAVLEQVLAARTGALAHARLGEESTRQPTDPALGAGTVPFIASWPLTDSVVTPQQTTVPDVAGLTLREAARRLHERGLRMRLVGWGRIERASPAAGSSVPVGSLVQVFARERGSSR